MITSQSVLLMDVSPGANELASGESGMPSACTGKLRLPFSVSAVLPAYNEAAVIEQTVVRTHAALEEYAGTDFEIVVVNDGSSDETATLVTSLSQRMDNVRLISHASNLGYGAALRSGFHAARGDMIWYLDSDAQFEPGDIKLLLPYVNEDTIVSGIRVRRSDTWIRTLNNRAFFTLVRAVIGPTAKDANCAFKIFPRALTENLTATGATLPAELLARARRAGYRVVEVPIPHYPRMSGKPTGANPRVIARAFIELYQLRRRLHSRY